MDPSKPPTKSSTWSHGSKKSSSSSLSSSSSPPPPPHKSSRSSKPSESSKPPKLSNMSKPPVDKHEVQSVWEMVKGKEGRGDMTILAIIEQKYEKSLRALAKKYKTSKSLTSFFPAFVISVVPRTCLFDHWMILRKSIWRRWIDTDIAILESQILTATPKTLQGVIDSMIWKGCKTLQLLVSATVQTINYCISEAVKEVHIVSCGTGRPDVLRICSRSTYCGVKTYAWDFRPDNLRTNDCRITYGEGCYFDVSGDEEVGQLRGTPTAAPDLKDEDLTILRNHAANFKNKTMHGPSRSPGTGDADGTASWLSECKAFLDVVLGVSGSCAAFYFSARGFFMRGPVGFFLSSGSFAGAVSRYTSMPASGAIIAAAGAAYFIPWEKVFEYAKQLLLRIWDFVHDVFGWIWEKMKTLASTVIPM